MSSVGPFDRHRSRGCAAAYSFHPDTDLESCNQVPNRISLKTGLEKEIAVTQFGEMPAFAQLKEEPSVISQLRRLRSVQHASTDVAKLRLQIVSGNSCQRRGINRVRQHNDRCKVRAAAPAEFLSCSGKVKRRLDTPTNTTLRNQFLLRALEAR